MCHLVFKWYMSVNTSISISICVSPAEGNSTHDTDLIKLLITVTSISLLIFQLKYLLPYISTLKVYSLAFLQFTQKNSTSYILFTLFQIKAKAKGNC